MNIVELIASNLVAIQDEKAANEFLIMFAGIAALGIIIAIYALIRFKRLEKKGIRVQAKFKHYYRLPAPTNNGEEKILIQPVFVGKVKGKEAEFTIEYKDDGEYNFKPGDTKLFLVDPDNPKKYTEINEKGFVDYKDY